MKAPQWKDSGTIATLAAFSGIGETISLPHVNTDNDDLMRRITQNGGPVILSTRAEQASAFGRAVIKKTNSPWYHSEICIPRALAEKARRACPDLMVRKPSPRWSNPRPGQPVPMVQGIPSTAMDFECVSSGLYVCIDRLQNVVRQGEQVMAWLPTGWSEDQKLAIAIEAYRWVGEIYDVFEIGNWVIPFIPNPPAIKVCSTATQTWIAAGDTSVISWATARGLDPQRIAPRDNADWCLELGFEPIGAQCSVDDYLRLIFQEAV